MNFRRQIFYEIFIPDHSIFLNVISIVNRGYSYSTPSVSLMRIL